MQIIYPLFLKTVTISGFVFIMMVLIEFINVQSHNFWKRLLTQNTLKQYIFAGLLGAIPGCLGAFSVVALYSHRLISFGALVTTMIATSGDEAFVMFASFPQKALILTLIILVVGIIAGMLTDRFFKPQGALKEIRHNELPIHQEVDCKCFSTKQFIYNLLHPTLYRLCIIVIILSLMIGLYYKVFFDDASLWMRITIFATFAFALFVSISVPNHFLEEHIWNHIVKKHVPRIFLWVFGISVVMHLLMQHIDIATWMNNNMFWMLIIAVLVGIIPESGPHLIFVTLFASGTIPFSILLASSISQDGHGMLPLFAESKKSFIWVKLINMFFALIIGALGLLLKM